jgi:hypothetical protein
MFQKINCRPREGPKPMLSTWAAALVTSRTTVAVQSEITRTSTDLGMKPERLVSAMQMAAKVSPTDRMPVRPMPTEEPSLPKKCLAARRPSTGR